MSTKVYDAWRVPKEQIFEFVEWYDSVVFPRLKAKFDQLVFQRLCEHSEVRCLVIGSVKPDAVVAGARHTEGKCVACDSFLKGEGFPVEGVKPVEDGRDVWTEVSAMIRAAERGLVVAERLSWARGPPMPSDAAGRLGRRLDAGREVLKLVTSLSEGERRDSRDLDAGVTMTLHEDYWLILPRGESWTYDGLPRPPVGTTYAYWNNSDKPLSVGPKEWKRRQEAWHAVLGKARWMDYWVVDGRRDAFSASLRLQPNDELLDQVPT